MEIFGIKFGSNSQSKSPANSTATKPEMSAEMAEFADFMKEIKEGFKKRLETQKDNFKKMSEATGNYENLEHLKKHIENPLNDLKIARDTILDATKRQKALEDLATNLRIPKEEVVKIAEKIKKSTSNLIEVMGKPNLAADRLKSIAKVLNERFKFLEKIKI